MNWSYIKNLTLRLFVKLKKRKQLKTLKREVFINFVLISQIINISGYLIFIDFFFVMLKKQLKILKGEVFINFALIYQIIGILGYPFYSLFRLTHVLLTHLFCFDRACVFQNNNFLFPLPLSSPSFASYLYPLLDFLPPPINVE